MNIYSILYENISWKNFKYYLDMHFVKKMIAQVYQDVIWVGYSHYVKKKLAHLISLGFNVCESVYKLKYHY